MKWGLMWNVLDAEDVAPFGGAWIEISKNEVEQMQKEVAPFGGSWIEISGTKLDKPTPERRTLWGCVD